MHCGEDEEACAAMREEMVAKATLGRLIPRGASCWPRGLELPQCPLPAPAVKTHARSGDLIAKAVAEDALMLAGLDLDDNFRPDTDGEFVNFGAVLSWREGDVTTRIYDDLADLAHQGGMLRDDGGVQVPLDDPGAFAAWQQAMARSRFGHPA